MLFNTYQEYRLVKICTNWLCSKCKWQWRHRNKTHSWYSGKNSLQNTSRTFHIL